jgi:hypothetical protein
MVGVLDPEDVARELDDRVLEAPSGSDQRDTPLAGEPDRGQCAIHGAIGTGRRDEEPCVTSEPFLRPIRSNVGRRHPFETDPPML